MMQEATDLARKSEPYRAIIMMEMISKITSINAINYKLLLSIISTAMIFALLGGCLGWYIRQPGTDVRAYANMRTVAIQSHLDNQDTPYVLLVGDSQAELQSPSEKICGKNVINAGVSGAGTMLYSKLFNNLMFIRRPDLVVVAIGTNDLVLSHKPSSQRAISRFESSLGALISMMPAPANKIIFTAIPPIGKSLSDKLDISSVLIYSTIINNFCLKKGCVYIDAYADQRTIVFGIAKDGAMKDELHLANYKRVNVRINDMICNH